MAYNLGTSKGTVEIKYDTAGVASAKASNDELKRQLEEIGRMSPTIRIDLDIATALGDVQTMRTELNRIDGLTASARIKLEGVADALMDLVVLLRELDKIDGREVTITINIRGLAAALANLALLERELQEISRQRATPRVDLVGYRNMQRQLAFLEQQLARINRQQQRIGQNRGPQQQTGALNKLQAAADKVNGAFQGMVSGILMLWPALIPPAAQAVSALTALVPIGASISAAFIGAAAAAAVAGTAVAGFALVAVTNLKPVGEAIKNYTKAQQEYNAAISSKDKQKALADMRKAMAALDPQQRKLAQEAVTLKNQWTAFAKTLRPQTFGIASAGMRILSTLMRQFAPLIRTAANAGLQFMRSLQRIVQSDAGWKRLVQTMNRDAKPIFANLNRFAISLVHGLINLGNAAARFGITFSNWMARAGKSFEVFTGSNKFQQSMQRLFTYAEQNGPVVANVLRNLATAFANIVRAAAPMGTSVLGTIQRMTQAFAHWTGGNAFKSALQGIFDYAKKNGPVVGQAISEISKALVAVMRAAAPMGPVILRVVTILAKLVRLVADSPFGPFIVGALSFGLAMARILPVILAVRRAMLALAATRTFGWIMMLGPTGAVIVALLALAAAFAYAYVKNKQFRKDVNETAKAIGRFFVRMWKDAAGGVKSAWRNITSAVSSGAKATLRFVTTPLRALQTAWHKVWDQGLVKAAKAAWQKIKDIARDARNVGKSIADGIIHGLGSFGSQIKKYLLDALRGAWAAIKGFFGISSPSKLMEETGKNIVAGLTVGLDKYSVNAIESMKGIAASMVAAAPSPSSFSGERPYPLQYNIPASPEGKGNAVHLNFNIYGAGDPTGVKRILTGDQVIGELVRAVRAGVK